MKKIKINENDKKNKVNKQQIIIKCYTIVNLFTFPYNFLSHIARSVVNDLFYTKS